jgi:hypothetical protein
MNPAISIVLCGIFCSVTTAQATEQRNNSGNVAGGNFNKAHEIIGNKCTVCHSKDRIDIALKSGKDMSEIQKVMEKRGAHLSSNEREVLGIFWKESTPISKK